jgi:hypothetical protein
LKAFYNETYNFKLTTKPFRSTAASLAKEVITADKFLIALKAMRHNALFFEEFIYFSLLFLTGARSCDIRVVTFKELKVEKNKHNFYYF